MASNAKAVKECMKRCLQFFGETKGFNRLMSKCELLEGETGRCLVKMRVDEDITNIYGTLHGGMSAYLVDTVTSIALVTHDPDSLKNLGVSVDLNVTYLKAAKQDEEILIEGLVTKRGRNLVFTEAELRSFKTGDILVKGRHTKYLV